MARGNNSFARASLSLWLLLCSMATVMAQRVAQSNLTSDLPMPGTARYFLNGSQVNIPSVKLVPLVQDLQILSQGSFEGFNITGHLVNVDPTNANSLVSSNIAYISCDESDYPGNLKASNTVGMALTNNVSPPGAIILFSTESNHCNFTFSGGNPSNASILTTVDPMIALQIENLKLNSKSPGFVSILPDLSALQPNNGTAPVGGTNNGSSNSANNVLGPSPTTAVAMIILYSITGIITALFLVIIITGAIRAHRHPERYGPRNAIGRPRQSRAKGIARAMLETLPIVKFGDQEEPKPASRGTDIELGANRATDEGTTSEEGATQNPTSEEVAHDGQPGQSTDGVGTALPTKAATAGPVGAHEDSGLGCSICTEDFAKGQDIRVLPCNHKFHPECVDPWLLNVSGTCPLCRVDLRPPTSDDTATAGPNSSDGDSPTELPPALNELAFPAGASSSAAPQRQRGSLSVYLHNTLNIRRMRDATPEERIAALRRLRTASRANRAPENGEDPAEAERGTRLTARLRDRFRIRTRRQGGDTAAVTEEAAAPTTDVDAPAPDPLERRRTGTFSG